MNPHLRPRPCPSWAALYRADPWPSLGWEVQTIRLRVASRGRGFPDPSRSSVVCLCCVILWYTNNPAAISFPHSLHFTRSFLRYQYVGPSPIIFLPYAATEFVYAAWHGWHAMLTSFPTLVCRPTRSNKLTRASNAHCSQRGSEDATMLLS